jgi:DNA-binding transcriptional ArsR family regulator
MSSVKKDDLVYKALADSRRREILDLLKDEPRTTGDICSKFKKLDRCTVMQHLSVLEKADLIITKREGRYRWNYINARSDPSHLRPLDQQIRITIGRNSYQTQT